jgi:glycerophosphoryl diester phosphodiesterase
MHDVYILGHRGASGTAPENTKAAFNQALQVGADGVELDVHLTKDKKLVVIHDERVDRTTDGIGYIKDLTLKEIKKLDAGSYFSPKYAGERILTLEEGLELTQSSNLINIEIKNIIIKYKYIEREVVNIIKKMNLESKVICSSFNHYSIALIKQLSPDIKTGLLYVSTLYQPWAYAESIGADAIHPQYYSVSSEIVNACHKNNIRVNVWSVDDKSAIKQMISNQVDTIITNYPEIALKILENNKQKYQ